MRLKFNRKSSGEIGPVRRRSDCFRWPSITVTPLFWYALITLGVPLRNAAYNGNGARFADVINYPREKYYNSKNRKIIKSLTQHEAQNTDR